MPVSTVPVEPEKNAAPVQQLTKVKIVDIQLPWIRAFALGIQVGIVVIGLQALANFISYVMTHAAQLQTHP